MIMKKIFLSILSAAMFAACAKSETENIMPENPEPGSEAQMVYVEIGATAGGETKAAYDENLNAYWEGGDQILAIQGSATSNTTETWAGQDYNTSATTLDLSGGIGSNTAAFAGDIAVWDSNHNRYFHFASPASDAVLTTSTHTPGASGLSGNYSTHTTCTYTIPEEQDGIWHPFLCASTAGQTTAEAIDHVSFGQSHNACFAIRVFESNGKTPKRITTITITAENNIIGTIDATTDNNGSFADTTFNSTGTGNTIIAENLENIEMLGKYYEYRFEVLPVNSGTITILLGDEDNSSIVRYANAKDFKANYRSGVNVSWDKAGVKLDTTTWFDDSCANGGLSALASKNTIYCDFSTFGVNASNIAEKGIIINGDTEHPYKIEGTGTKFHTEIAATRGDGEYTVMAYIVLKDDSEPLTSEEKKVYVVNTDNLPAIASHTISSSYNSNAEIVKTNDIEGNVIQANIQLNDDNWISKDLIKSITFHHADFSTAMETNGTTVMPLELAVPELRKYVDCRIEVVFKNGYTLNTPYYDINVTGIPYYWINNPNGERIHDQTISSSYSFYIPTTTMDVNLVYNIDLVGKTVANIGTLTVDDEQIFSASPNYNRTDNERATIPLSLSSKSINFSYNDKSSSSWSVSTSYSLIYEISIKY